MSTGPRAECPAFTAACEKTAKGKQQRRCRRVAPAYLRREGSIGTTWIWFSLRACSVGLVPALVPGEGGSGSSVWRLAWTTVTEDVGGSGEFGRAQL